MSLVSQNQSVNQEINRKWFTHQLAHPLLLIHQETVIVRKLHYMWRTVLRYLLFNNENSRGRGGDFRTNPTSKSGYRSDGHLINAELWLVHVIVNSKYRIAGNFHLEKIFVFYPLL